MLGLTLGADEDLFPGAHATPPRGRPFHGIGLDAATPVTRHPTIMTGSGSGRTPRC